MSAPGVLALAPLSLAVLGACDSQVLERSPRPDGDGGAGAGGAAPVARVEVVGPFGEPVPGVAVLVHDPAGALRARYASAANALEVPAFDGDFVSVVGWEEDSFTWRMDTVLVTASARRPRFYRRTPLPDPNPNAPIRLEIAQALAPGVHEYIASGACGGGSFWQPEPVSLVVEGYQGCGYLPSSTIVGMGRGADKRLMTFDYVDVPHGAAAEATVLFPSTPVERVGAQVTIDWPPSVTIAEVAAGIRWDHWGHTYIEELDGVPAFAPAAPFGIASTMPEIGVGTTRVHASASIGELEDLYHYEASLLSPGAALWNPARLRAATPDDEAGAYRMAPPAFGAFTETGDALAIQMTFDKSLHVLWLPVPDDVEPHVIPMLEIPAELGDGTFPLDPSRGFRLTHDDRFDDASYADYLDTGVGAVDHLRLAGESLEPREAAGRYDR